MHNKVAKQSLCMLLFLLSLGNVTSSGVVFPNGAVVEKIGDGFLFTEGPLWCTAGYLLFSDIHGNTIYKWTPERGCEVFLSPSGNTNGIAEDTQGRLILAQQGLRRLARIELDGTQTILDSAYDGKRFNSPNDIAVRSDGSIYFTDPPYGIIKHTQQELGFCGVYRIGAPGDAPQLLIDSIKKPNGIVFSPDESKIYIGDTDSARILSGSIRADGMLDNVHVFARLGSTRYVDGLTVDSSGNLYCAGTVGWIWVLSPQGVLIDSLAVPGKTTNVEWGGEGWPTLFVTSATSVYRIRFNGSNVRVGGVRGNLVDQETTHSSTKKFCSVAGTVAPGIFIVQRLGRNAQYRYTLKGHRLSR